MLEMFSGTAIILQVSSQTREFLQCLYFMFKAAVGKPLETMLGKNTAFRRMSARCSVANCCASVVSVCKQQYKKLTSRVDCLRGKSCQFFFYEQKRFYGLETVHPKERCVEKLDSKAFVWRIIHLV